MESLIASDLSTLRRRVRAEFLEMPGLRLTLHQAARLWHLDQHTCRDILLALVRERFLLCTRSGAFVRAEAV